MGAIELYKCQSCGKLHINPDPKQICPGCNEPIVKRA